MESKLERLVSMGMNLDFKARTVEGLPFELRRIVISEVTETAITFHGPSEDKEHAFSGVIKSRGAVACQ